MGTCCSGEDKYHKKETGEFQPTETNQKTQTSRIQQQA